MATPSPTQTYNSFFPSVIAASNPPCSSSIEQSSDVQTAQFIKINTLILSSFSSPNVPTSQHTNLSPNNPLQLHQHHSQSASLLHHSQGIRSSVKLHSAAAAPATSSAALINLNHLNINQSSSSSNNNHNRNSISAPLPLDNFIVQNNSSNLQEESHDGPAHNSCSISPNQLFNISATAQRLNSGLPKFSLDKPKRVSQLDIMKKSFIEQEEEDISDKSLLWTASFLTLLLFLAVLDAIYLFFQHQLLPTSDIVTTSNIRFFISCGVLVVSPIFIIFFIWFKSNILFIDKLRSSTLIFSFALILTQCAYFETITIAIQISSSFSSQSTILRGITFMLISRMFSKLIVFSKRSRELSHLLVLTFITARVLVSSSEGNLIQILVIFVPFLTSLHHRIRANQLRDSAVKYATTNSKLASIQKFRRLLRKEPSLLQQLPGNAISNRQVLDSAYGGSGTGTGIGLATGTGIGTAFNPQQSPKSGINSNAFILGQSPSLNILQSRGHSNSSSHINNNHNQSHMSSLHLIQPFILNPPSNQFIFSGPTLSSKQQSSTPSHQPFQLNSHPSPNSNNSQRTSREVYTKDPNLHALLPHSYTYSTSLVDKQQQPKSQQVLLLQLHSSTPPESPNSVTDRIDQQEHSHLKKLKDEDQMTKISELDLEQEHSKPAPKSQLFPLNLPNHAHTHVQQQQQRLLNGQHFEKTSRESHQSSSNQHSHPQQSSINSHPPHKSSSLPQSNHTTKSSPIKGGSGDNNNNISQQFELKSLIEQIIEVDGVVVFDAESENVVFANQSILALLETDTSHLLRELHQLKQVPVLDEKSAKDNDFSFSNLLKHIFKDSGAVNQSSPLIGPNNTTAGKVSFSKAGSVSLLNEVKEEEETEVECNPKPKNRIILEGTLDEKLSLASPQTVSAAAASFTASNNKPLLNFPPTSSSSSGCNLSLHQPGSAAGIAITPPLALQLNNSSYISPTRIRRPIPLHMSSSLPTNAKKYSASQQTSRTPNARTTAVVPPLTIYVDSMVVTQNDEEEENYQSLRPTKKKAESIFKTLSPQFSASQRKIEGINRSAPSNPSNSEIFNQTPNQEAISFTNIAQKRDTLEQLFPSFISSISFMQHTHQLNILIQPTQKLTFSHRRSIQGHGSVNTIERDRNTLKEIIDEVRSRSQTIHAPHRKISIINRKKALQSKRLLNFSSHPEVVFTNVMLYKESTSKLYLAKYSVIEHAGRILHVITIRDISNEIFETLLERQSNLFVEELYRHLNFTEISQVIQKSLAQLKELKHHVKDEEHKVYVRPIRFNLRLFNYLLHDIFDIRSLQQRTFSLHKDVFDLQQILVKLKKMTIEYRNDVQFSFYYDSRIPIQIINDSERICQILTNLLVNTCKLVNTSQIFLKAKLSDQTAPIQFIKVIVENRQLKKPQKEQILNAFQAPYSQPAPDSLAYHFSITNLLAKQVSNHKHQLKVVSSNSSNYIKFKFFIFLFPDTSSSTIKPILPVTQSSSITPNPSQQQQDQHHVLLNQQTSLQIQRDNSRSSQQHTPNSLYHLDDDIISQEGGTLTPQTSNLDKGHIKNLSDDEPYQQQQSLQQFAGNLNEDRSTIRGGDLYQSQKQIKTIDLRHSQQLSKSNLPDYLPHGGGGNKDGTYISIEPSETSERGDQFKTKDFDILKVEIPVKFIHDIHHNHL